MNENDLIAFNIREYLFRKTEKEYTEKKFR